VQIAGPSGDWIPLSGITPGGAPAGSQFLDVAVSTALTIPSIPTGVVIKGSQYVAILIAQVQTQWLRTDGNDVTAGPTGGLQMLDGDFRIVYGLNALKAIRVIRGAPGGALAVEYYFFRH
jgi:hypothetical protein